MRFSEAPSTKRPQAPSAMTVSPDDAKISVKSITYNGKTGTLSGYVAQPADPERHPGIIVIHENRGLVEYIKDVARRLAKSGYVTLVPDLLSRMGGTEHFASLDEIKSALRSIPHEEFISDLNTALDHLKSMPCVYPDRLGVTGFRFGGGIAWRLLTKRPDLKAGVPFYGAAPPSADVPKIQAAVLAIYAELDEPINATIPELEKVIHKSGVRYEKVVYPGVDHAFHNDTGILYDPEAARNAWARTLVHFARYLVQ
jgi:carboxymethylenebutenolidase